MTRYSFICGLAAGLTVMLAAIPAPAWAKFSGNPLTVIAKLVMPLDGKVGARTAGLLCFPNGALRLRDFVVSEPDFAAIVQQEIAKSAWGQRAALQPTDAPSLQVDLVALHANLCARDYGLTSGSERQRLSGQAAFTFAWRLGSIGSAQFVTVPIILNIRRGQAVFPPTVFQQAVIELVRQIAESEVISKTY